MRDGAKAFFTDMLQLEHFDGLTKDVTTYPKYSQTVADSAREQTLRTMVDLVVDQNRDYRDIFTTNETFINRALAAVYKVPYRSRQEWTKVTLPEEQERSGILTQVTFLSLFSHPAASSPTKRGVKLHEIFTCLQDPRAAAERGLLQGPGARHRHGAHAAAGPHGESGLRRLPSDQRSLGPHARAFRRPRPAPHDGERHSASM